MEIHPYSRERGIIASERRHIECERHHFGERERERERESVCVCVLIQERVCVYMCVLYMCVF